MRPSGYATLSDPEGTTKEWDTITCSHCQKIVFVTKDAAGRVTAPESQMDFCRGCMKAICARCGGSAGCAPFEKRLEEYERAARHGQRLDALLASG